MTADFTVGDRHVSYTTHVQAQPSTFATVATAPRTDAAAQHPSILVVTVDVTISTVPLTEPTTTSSTSTTVAVDHHDTVAPVPVVTDSFTITVDYGRASAHSAWLAKATVRPMRSRSDKANGGATLIELMICARRDGDRHDDGRFDADPGAASDEQDREQHGCDRQRPPAFGVARSRACVPRSASRLLARTWPATH